MPFLQWARVNHDLEWSQRLNKLLKWNKKIEQKPLFKLPNGKL